MKEVIAIDKSIIIYRKCESRFYFHQIINGPGIKENGGADWKMAAICCIFNGWKQQYMLCAYGNTARRAEKQNHERR